MQTGKLQNGNLFLDVITCVALHRKLLYFKPCHIVSNADYLVCVTSLKHRAH